MKLVWAPLALQKAAEISTYIAKDKPQAAKRWLKILLKKTDQLIRFPHQGRMVPELGKQEVREIIFDQYRIIYKLTKNQIELLTIRHGSQKFKL